jgi:predicted HTH domain antitoxin
MKCDKCNSELTLEQQVKMLQKEVEELQKELQNRPVYMVPCYLDNRIHPLNPVYI